MPAGELDEGAAPLRRERDPGGVLVVGDRVDELGPQPARDRAGEAVDVETVVVERDRRDLERWRRGD